MAQYSNFEEFMALNFNPLGNPGPTLPPHPAYATQPPAVHNGTIETGHETLLEPPMPSASTTHPPTFYAPTTGEREGRVHERLVVLERMVQWLYDNQLKLLDSVQKVIANLGKMEQGMRATKATLDKLSEDFNNWMREADGTMDTDTSDGEEGSETDVEEDRYTDALVDGNFLSQLE
jgi:hypothetical protein